MYLLSIALGMVLNIIQLSTYLSSLVGNLIMVLSAGVDCANSLSDPPIAESIDLIFFLLFSALIAASSVIELGILDMLIPVFIAIRSSNAPAIFELNDFCLAPIAEFKSSLIEPSILDLRFLKNFI